MAGAFCIEAQLNEISWKAHKRLKCYSLLLYVHPSSVNTGTSHFFLAIPVAGLTHHGDQKGAYPKPFLHSALGKQTPHSAPCQWEASYTDLPTEQWWKNREREVCRCFEVLLCCEVPLHVKSTIHSFSDLFFLIRGKHGNYSLPDYKWNYKSLLRA